MVGFLSHDFFFCFYCGGLIKELILKCDEGLIAPDSIDQAVPPGGEGGGISMARIHGLDQHSNIRSSRTFLGFWALEYFSTSTSFPLKRRSSVADICPKNLA